MNEKQLFSVVIRGIGVITFLDGLRIIYFAVAQWASLPAPQGALLVQSSLIYGVLLVILGGILVRWPHWVVHLAWLERLPTIGRMADHDISD